MVLIELANGEKKEFQLREINPVDRAKIFKKHLKMKEFMEASKNKEEITDFNNFLQDSNGVMDFVNDVLSAGFKELDLTQIKAAEADKLAAEHMTTILGVGGKN